MKRVHIVVTGQVQGVGFRYTMQLVAGNAGATGWVRNCPDGSVEAEVEGTDAAVQTVVDWARRGPRGGWVAECRVSDVDPTGSPAFEVRR
ncbi:acylphosphatase [Microbacterium sp.]|uniref:acylphosphatase n=1 Tax=Microbacterium sp. TaxID=51671 RepID=UPI003C71D1F6